MTCVKARPICASLWSGWSPCCAPRPLTHSSRVGSTATSRHMACGRCARRPTCPRRRQSGWKCWSILIRATAPQEDHLPRGSVPEAEDRAPADAYKEASSQVNFSDGEGEYYEFIRLFNSLHWPVRRTNISTNTSSNTNPNTDTSTAFVANRNLAKISDRAFAGGKVAGASMRLPGPTLVGFEAYAECSGLAGIIYVPGTSRFAIRGGLSRAVVPAGAQASARKAVWRRQARVGAVDALDDYVVEKHVLLRICNDCGLTLLDWRNFKEYIAYDRTELWTDALAPANQTLSSDGSPRWHLHRPPSSKSAKQEAPSKLAASSDAPFDESRRCS
eukprot:2837209-Pleurochrysis_carterae.AAC.1